VLEDLSLDPEQAAVHFASESIDSLSIKQDIQLPKNGALSIVFARFNQFNAATE